MENIFENAKFGDKFRTRDGRKAIFINCATERNDVYFKYYCTIEDLDGIYEVFDSQGRCHRDSDSPIDIVSEWQEEISEEELDELAEQWVHNHATYPDARDRKTIIKEAYKASCKEAFKRFS